MILPNKRHYVHHSAKHEDDVRDRALSRGFTPGDRDLIPGYSTLGLGCTKGHWNGLFSDYFPFPLSVQFHYCCLIYFAIDGTDKAPQKH